MRFPAGYNAGMLVEPLQPRTASDADLAALHALHEAIEREALPGESVRPVAQALLDYRNPPPYRDERWWVAREGKGVVAAGTAHWDDVPDNRQTAYIDVAVHPDARRRGLGRALLGPAVGQAAAWGCTLVDLEARVGGPGEGFLAALGAERRYGERHSAWRPGEADRSLLGGWVARAAERASEYSLVGWDGPCPDDVLGPFVGLLHVMNTAPLERWEHDDERHTPERWRAEEAGYAARGLDQWTLVARHDPSGELAGYTELLLPRAWPQVAQQGNTGVWPKHRNRGLGRWLKAAMALRLLGERPAVARVETWNAGSNDAMLAINVAMGFRPLQRWGLWQARLDLLRRAATG